MDTTKETRELKLKRWAELIHECKVSGLSAKEWMSRNGIRKHQFYYWQRQLRTQALEVLCKEEKHSGPVDALVEITQPDLSVSQVPSTNEAVTPETSGSTPVLTIEIADAVIRVSEDTSPKLLRMALQEIRHAE